MKPTKTTYKAFATSMLDLMLDLASALYGVSARPERVVKYASKKCYANGVKVQLGLDAYYAWTGEDGVARYWEYDHLVKSELVGEFNGPWQEALVALCAHEVAHHVQLNIGEGQKASIQARNPKANLAWTGRKSNQTVFHLGDWQAIYAELRQLALGAVRVNG